MSTEVHLTKAVKLNDSNYHSWAFFTSAFLRSKGFWDHVTGTRPAPAATNIAAVAKDAQEKDMALGFIQMSLEESQQPYLRLHRSKGHLGQAEGGPQPEDFVYAFCGLQRAIQRYQEGR